MGRKRKAGPLANTNDFGSSKFSIPQGHDWRRYHVFEMNSPIATNATPRQTTQVAAAAETTQAPLDEIWGFPKLGVPQSPQ